MDLPPWDADWPARRRRLDPLEFLRAHGLRAGHTIVDLGCGGGFFALAAAEIVGSEGRVIAIDADVRAVDRLTAVAPGNLEARVGRAEDGPVCDACADMVLIANALHDFDDAATALRHARSSLKPDGRLVNLDWKGEETDDGPPLHKRFPQSKGRRLITDAGFRIVSEAPVGATHYVICAN